MRNFTAERFREEARDLEREAGNLRRLGESQEADAIAHITALKNYTADKLYGPHRFRSAAR